MRDPLEVMRTVSSKLVEDSKSYQQAKTQAATILEMLDLNREDLRVDIILFSLYLTAAALIDAAEQMQQKTNHLS